ncbi:MAG: methyltransferase, partial [Oscillospiraceae bacterium]|nr:methyltransferase [Oscillospiraceae bacterium]
KAENSCIKNGDEIEKIASNETECNIDDITECAARILRFGGRLCICHRPERTFDAFFSMRNHGIEPKRVRFVQKNGESAPWLVLIDGRKGGKAGLLVEKPLLMQTEGGTPSDEILNITEKYRKL